MRARAQAGAPFAPSVAISVTSTTPPITVTLAPPALIWTDSDENTIAWACGMRRRAFVEVVRAMLSDPDHGARVINLSAKRRGVAVDDLTAFLRDRYSAAPESRDTKPANDAREAAPLDGVDEVLATIGAERVPSRRKVGRGSRVVPDIKGGANTTPGAR